MCKEKKDCGCGCSVNESRSPHDTPVEKFVKKLGIGPGLMVKFENDPIEYWVKNLSANPERVFVYNPNDRIDPNRIYNKDVKKIVMSNRKPVDFKTMSLPEIHLTDVKLISKEEAFPHQYNETVNKSIQRLEALTSKKVVLENVDKTEKDLKYLIKTIKQRFRRTDIPETEPNLYNSINTVIAEFEKIVSPTQEQINHYYNELKDWDRVMTQVFYHRSLK